MTWGHITSEDLLKWTRVKDRQFPIRPDQPYDHLGIFTGCFAPVVDDVVNKQLTLVYSSIAKMPFHWTTPPYPRDSAGLSAATSDDGGKTWVKSSQNPILDGEPEGVEVNGFRDPYMAVWPTLDEVRGKEVRSIYGLVSGSIVSIGPTTFLYEIPKDDLQQWKYIGPLIDLPIRFEPSKTWGANYGTNWECTNFMTLTNGSISREFLVIGAEGDCERYHVESHGLHSALSPRTVRQQAWICGNLVKDGDSVKMEYQTGGILDHGSYYAASSFVDPPTGRRITHGWIPEEDTTIDHAENKGWNGCLAIPRELFLLTVPDVVRAIQSPLSEISCMELVSGIDGTATLHTLGVRPMAEMGVLREDCLHRQNYHQVSLPHLLPSETTEQGENALQSMSSATWELETTISITPSCETAGFYIRHNSDRSICTTIIFSPLSETISVHREASSPYTEVNKCTEQGSFTLFTTKTSTNGFQQEKLHLRIISDGDVLEVFANDRFALATMVYTGDYELNNGITAFATGGTDSALFECITVWDGLAAGRSLIIDD